MPLTINDYINESPAELQDRLRVIYVSLRSEVPSATEAMSYGMPTLKLNGKNLIHFAASTYHIGIYPGPAAVDHFAEKLRDYKTSKGTIQLPHDRQIPIELIKEIVRWSAKNINGSTDGESS